MKLFLKSLRKKRLNFFFCIFFSIDIRNYFATFNTKYKRYDKISTRKKIIYTNNFGWCIFSPVLNTNK